MESLRDYVFLGTTHSLCPHCRRRVEAKIIVRDKRVYFRKRCPEHGVVEDFVCSDVDYYDRHEFEQPIQAVMVNTNGIRLGRDSRLVDELAEMRDRLEIYLQFDGFDERTHQALRGEPLAEVKEKALDALDRAGLRSTLVCTVEHNT